MYIGVCEAAARTGSKKIHKILYYNLLTSANLNAHLAKINRQAEEMFSWMVKQMAEREGVTELLKRGKTNGMDTKDEQYP